MPCGRHLGPAVAARLYAFFERRPRTAAGLPTGRPAAAAHPSLRHTRWTEQATQTGQSEWFTSTSEESLGVADCGSAGHLAAQIVGGRCPASPDSCRRWLPFGSRPEAPASPGYKVVAHRIVLDSPCAPSNRRVHPLGGLPPEQSPLAAASAIMSPGPNGMSTTYWLARRRHIAGRSKVIWTPSRTENPSAQAHTQDGGGSAWNSSTIPVMCSPISTWVSRIPTVPSGST